MSETTLQVDIVSAEGAIYSGSVNMVFTMGISGELGIAPGHAQLLTMLKPGPVRLLTQGGQLEEVLYVSGGILEVQPFGVTILADTAVRAADLDEAIALEAKQKAENMLKKLLIASHDTGVPKNSYNIDNIAHINTGDISFLDFDINNDQMQFLYNQGRISVQKLLQIMQKRNRGWRE